MVRIHYGYGRVTGKQYLGLSDGRFLEIIDGQADVSREHAEELIASGHGLTIVDDLPDAGETAPNDANPAPHDDDPDTESHDDGPDAGTHDLNTESDTASGTDNAPRARTRKATP